MTSQPKLQQVLKVTCTEENMYFICHNNINAKRHLNKSNFHPNDHDIFALVRHFKHF